MNYYRFEDKETDQNFLDGKAVMCKAVIPHNDDSLNKVAPGNAIVIMLSNGAKYKGYIVNFHHVVEKGHAIGEIEIVRQQPQKN